MAGRQSKSWKEILYYFILTRSIEHIALLLLLPLVFSDWCCVINYMQRNRDDAKEKQSLVKVATDCTEQPERAIRAFIYNEQKSSDLTNYMSVLCSFCHGNLFARRHMAILNTFLYRQSGSLCNDRLSRQLCLPVKLATMTYKYFFLYN